MASQVHKIAKQCIFQSKPHSMQTPRMSYTPNEESFLQEMTTSHSEHERTNSVCSSVNSLGSACTHKSRKLSAPVNDGSIPWCGCWGAGCV